jgi:hypothetical protein
MVPLKVMTSSPVMSGVGYTVVNTSHCPSPGRVQHLCRWELQTSQGHLHTRLLPNTGDQTRASRWLLKDFHPKYRMGLMEKGSAMYWKTRYFQRGWQLRRQPASQDEEMPRCRDIQLQAKAKNTAFSRLPCPTGAGCS